MKNKKRFLKITGIVLALFILMLVGGAFLFSHFAQKKLRSTEFGEFELKSEKIETNLFRRQITLENTVLSKPGAKDEIKIPQAKLSGIKLIHMLFSNELVVKKFRVDSPAITFYKNNEETAPRDSTGSSEQKRIIHIKHLEIPDLQFSFLDEQKDKPDTVFTTLINLNVWNLNTDTTNAVYSAPAFNFKRLKLLAEKGSLIDSKGIYKLSFDRLNFDTEQPDLVVKSVKFNSPYSKYEIGRQTGVQTDWYDINVDSIVLADIKVSSLVNDTALIFKKTFIGNMQANIFRDKHLPFPEKPDTKLPSELIQSIPFGLHNDSLVIQNANIRYEERGKKAEKEGKVTFNNLHATLVNFSNIDSLKKGATKLSAKAEVMNSATLNVDFTFTEPGANDPSQVTGTLEPTKFAIFNPMLQPYLGVEIQSGQILRLAFNFGYNNEQSNGDMIFEYQDLDFVIRNKKSDSKKLILTFLADNIVVRDENIKGQSSYRKGEISNTREKKKAIFNFWWKSLQSGLKSVAAI